MAQQTFSSGDFDRYVKTTKRQVFLEQMDQVIPWTELIGLLKPYYPNAENGRPAIALEKMLRIHFLQHWFALSDPAAEEAIHDSRSMRAFARIDLGKESAPDETTICRFRHLLEKHNLGPKIMKIINVYLAENGFRVSTGTIVDATIIAAPSSTKNAEGKRDPEMHQTKKGNQWYFGMKLHIGVDSKENIIHSVATTPANVHDSQMIPELLHGNERRLYGDSAYSNQKEKIRQHAPHAKDFTNKRAYRNAPLSDREKEKNRRKSAVRSLGETPFLIAKHLWGFTKTRYRGLAKNTHWLWITCALINIYVKRRALSAV
ncbi:MAG TPA: IS5 family transposase [Leptospiraceae bacterium]|nr:IS5 family transposase [Leptospiraceae bacterium]